MIAVDLRKEQLQFNIRNSWVLLNNHLSRLRAGWGERLPAASEHLVQHDPRGWL